MAFTEAVPDSNKFLEPVYLFRDGEMLIKAPNDKVWPHLVNYPSWQNYNIVEHVSGPVDGEGEVVRLEKEEAGVRRPPYYARTLRIIPGRKIVWKTFSDDPTGKGGFGIVEFGVEPADGGTLFRYNTMYESFVTFEKEEERDAFAEQQMDDIAKVFTSIFAKLKALAESPS